MPSRSFDEVVAKSEMLHNSKQEVVLAKVLRVVRPGGRLAYTVWGDPQDAAAGLGILLRAVETHGILSCIHI